MEAKPVVLLSPQAASHDKAMATFLAQHGQYHLILLQSSVEELAKSFDFEPGCDSFIYRMDRVMAQVTNHEGDFKRYIKEVDFFCITREEQEKHQEAIDVYIAPWLEHTTGGHTRKLVWWDANGGFWAGWRL